MEYLSIGEVVGFWTKYAKKKTEIKSMNKRNIFSFGKRDLNQLLSNESNNSISVVIDFQSEGVCLPFREKK